MTTLVTPTTQETSDNIVADIEGSIEQTIPPLEKKFTRVSAQAFSQLSQPTHRDSSMTRALVASPSP